MLYPLFTIQLACCMVDKIASLAGWLVFVVVVLQKLSLTFVLAMDRDLNLNRAETFSYINPWIRYFLFVFSFTFWVSKASLLLNTIYKCAANSANDKHMYKIKCPVRVSGFSSNVFFVCVKCVRIYNSQL